MSKNDSTINQDLLHKYFYYYNGNIYWKISYGSRKINTKCGCLDEKGYEYTMFCGKNLKNHRIIFMMFHGYLPKVVDHINGIKNDNRIENLRAATKSQNGFNSKISKANKSGVKGVSWDKKRKKWKVQISINCKNKCIGRYDDLELAELVATEARDKYYGKFARHQ